MWWCFVSVFMYTSLYYINVSVSDLYLFNVDPKDLRQGQAEARKPSSVWGARHTTPYDPPSAEEGAESEPNTGPPIRRPFPFLLLARIWGKGGERGVRRKIPGGERAVLSIPRAHAGAISLFLSCMCMCMCMCMR